MKKTTFLILTFLFFSFHAFAQPANDDPATATVLAVTASFEDAPLGGQDNIGATNSSDTDAQIPAPGCASFNGADVWYSVVVPADGNIILEADADPTGNGGDAGGAAYSGTIGSLVLLACNDDSGNGLYPQIVISDPALGGQTIFFRIWEFGGNADLMSFRVGAHIPPPPPANDNPSGAIALTPTLAFEDAPLGGQYNISATNSSDTDAQIPAPGCASFNGADVWYSVVVPADGNITLEADADPTGNGGDAGGAAYSGTIGNLTLIECDDDDGNGLYPLIVISDPALAGQTIFFRIWEFGGNADLTSFRLGAHSATSVSYTHLTLPTIYSV